MAGNKFNIKVSSWYRANGSTPGTPSNPLNDLLATLVNGVSGASGGKYAVADLTANAVFTPSVTDFLTNRSVTTGKPKAYLNWILFNEQFKLVSSSSGAEQVGDDQEFKVHVKTNLPITKNGYLYVYVSNETPNIPVYFDNLQVTHTRGPLLEETHYYPFGLTMAGISSKALNGTLENKIKFQGQEFNDAFDVDYYEFKYRQHDPQIGRFTQIDPLAEKYVYNSTYVFSENKVTGHIELEGLESLNINKISQIHRQSNTGKKDISSIKLNLRLVISNTTSNYNTKYNKGKSDLISFVQRLNGSELTVNDVAQIKSVSETKLTTTSNIIDGKFLEMTTQTTITEVKLDVDEVTSITQTISSTTSIMAIESIDSKDNSITVGISPISVINDPTKTSQINPGKDLSNLSPDLKNKVNLAIGSNNQAAFDKGKDVLKKALDAGDNLYK